MSEIKDIKHFLKKLKITISENRFYKNFLIKKKNDDENILNNHLIKNLNAIVYSQIDSDNKNKELLRIIQELKLHENKCKDVEYEDIQVDDNSLSDQSLNDKSLSDQSSDDNDNDIKEYNFNKKDHVSQDKKENVNVNLVENNNIITDEQKHRNELAEIMNNLNELNRNVDQLKNLVFKNK